MPLKLNTPDERYKDYIGQVIENKEAYAGQKAIHKAGIKYLPALGNMDLNTREGVEDYNSFKDRTLFPNFVSKTVDGMVGLIFRKAPVNNLPEQISYLINNADASGSSLKSIQKKLSRELMLTDSVALKVSMPESDKTIKSKLDAKNKNIRPYGTIYNAEDIIKVFYDTINNVEVISLVVLKEKRLTTKDEFNRVIEDNYRVLDLVDLGAELPVYRERLYDKNCEFIDGSEVLPRIQGKFFNEIPIKIIEINEGKKAPIEDLVKANLNYYKINASYTHGVFFAGFPTPTATGISKEEIPTGIGPSEFWISESDGAKFDILEAKAGGADKGERYLNKLETIMAALGANMLNPQKMAAETAESKKLDHQSQSSVLTMTSDAVQEASQWFCELSASWVGVKGKVDIKLNKDYFPSEMSPQMLTSLLAAVNSGNMSYETFWENLQKGEIANPNKSFDKEIQDIGEKDEGLDL